jgi:hypothetical protein
MATTAAFGNSIHMTESNLVITIDRSQIHPDRSIHVHHLLTETLKDNSITAAVRMSAAFTARSNPFNRHLPDAQHRRPRAQIGCSSTIFLPTPSDGDNTAFIICIHPPPAAPPSVRYQRHGYSSNDVINLSIVSIRYSQPTHASQNAPAS